MTEHIYYIGGFSEKLKCINKYQNPINNISSLLYHKLCIYRYIYNKYKNVYKCAIWYKMVKLIKKKCQSFTHTELRENRF